MATLNNSSWPAVVGKSGGTMEAETKNAVRKIADKVIPSHGTDKKLILVSGGTGFVGTWVINEFLANGYKVRTTVRSESKASDVKNTHSRYSADLECAIVSDITADGAFDEAVKGVDGVIHTASPFCLSVEDNKRDLLDPAIHGTNSILASVAKHAPQVERVVITSSFAAILNLTEGLRPGYTYTEKDWNPTTYEEAVKGDGATAYCASKTFAEKAAYDFVKEHQPNFNVVAVNPPMVYGPLAQKVIDLEHLNTSAADIWRFLDGSLADHPPPPPSFPCFVDVRNVAQAHLKAYERDTKENERFFVTSGTFTYAEVCRVLRNAFPERKEKIVDPLKADKVEHFQVDNGKSRRELGIEYIGLEQCIVDTGRSLIQVEEAGKKGSGYDGQEWFGRQGTRDS